MIPQKAIIENYRKKYIEGQLVDLSPITEKDLVDIVRLRNHPKMMYCFNQSHELTLSEQMLWYQKYLQRDDDLYWSIKDKHDNIIGTNRIYGITYDKCKQGSLMIDTAYAMTAPYAAEAIMLSLDFAFDVLGINIVINEDRHDNKNMNSISRFLGFQLLRITDIRGVAYNYYELYKENYNREAVEELIRLWMMR